MSRHLLLGGVVVASLVMTTTAPADEGMWLFNQPPLKQLKEQYDFTPPPGWLEHVQKSSASTPVGPARSSRRTGW